MWEADIDAGLNYLELLPTEGQEALTDDIDSAPLDEIKTAARAVASCEFLHGHARRIMGSSRIW